MREMRIHMRLTAIMIYPYWCFHFTVNEISRNKMTNCPRRLTAMEAKWLSSRHFPFPIIPRSRFALVPRRSGFALVSNLPISSLFSRSPKRACGGGSCFPAFFFVVVVNYQFFRMNWRQGSWLKTIKWKTLLDNSLCLPQPISYQSI